MRIGILGPPGADKSRVARAIGAEFDLPVVDNYVQRLQKSTDLALGPWSTYGEMFMVAGVRAAAEIKHENSVTVGTIMDTMVYAMIHSDVLVQRNEEHRQALFVTAQTAIQGLTMWSKEAFTYDLSFLIPYNDEQVKGKGPWERALNEAYPVVLEAFELPLVVPLGGETKDRIKIAKEIIQLAQEDNTQDEAQATEADEL